SDADYSKQARIVNGDRLFEVMANLEQYQAFTEDLFVFATKNYEEYGDLSDKLVGFEIGEDLAKEGDVVKFSGRYGSVRNEIDIRIKLLNHGRINSSITDTKTSRNMDSELSSNTKRNQFIGSLPIET